MKAMVIDRHGSPELFQLREIATPEPREGEVLIRTSYASVNPADWKIREGVLENFATFRFPLVTGFDAAGVVEAVGTGVTDFIPGDRVATLSDHLEGAQGSYAEKIRVRAIRVQHLPESLSFREAAAIPVAGATAYGATVDIGRAKRGDRVFVNGGAGGVGLFALQLASRCGASVATTCSPRNTDLVRNFGADLAIDYNSSDVLSELAGWAPDGLDLIVDAVGNDSLPADTARVVKRGGRIVCIFTAIKDLEGFDADLCRERDIELILNMSAHSRLEQHFKGVMDGFRDGGLKVPPLIELPLAEVAEAQRLSKEGHVRGKIVLKVAAL